MNVSRTPSSRFSTLSSGMNGIYVAMPSAATNVDILRYAQFIGVSSQQHVAPL